MHVRIVLPEPMIEFLKYKASLYQEQMISQQAYIKELCSTPEGRAKLANAMANPIRCGGWSYRNKSIIIE